MAWKQDDLDRLDAAITGGVRSVTFSDGRKTEFQDVDKMMALRNLMRGELLALSSRDTGRIPRATRGRMRRP